MGILNKLGKKDKYNRDYLLLGLNLIDQVSSQTNTLLDEFYQATRQN